MPAQRTSLTKPPQIIQGLPLAAGLVVALTLTACGDDRSRSRGDDDDDDDFTTTTSAASGGNTGAGGGGAGGGGGHDGGGDGGQGGEAGCVPITCAAEGKNCGSIPNGCGQTIDCGSEACDDSNACTDDACVEGVCQHHPLEDLTHCGYYLNAACLGGQCVSTSTYCVDDDLNDYWNKVRYTGPGYSSEEVSYCSCDSSDVLHAYLGGTVDIANVSCSRCEAFKPVYNTWVTLCF